MKLVFLDGQTLFSKLIRWVSSPKVFGLSEASHFAYVFEVNGQGVVFESDLLGCHLGFWKKKLEHSRIIEVYELNLTIDQENELWDKLVQMFDGKPWDYLGALYLAFAHLRYKFFRIPIPHKNKWAKSDAFFCNELVIALNLIKGLKPINFDASMLTPEAMRAELRKWFEGESC